MSKNLVKKGPSHSLIQQIDDLRVQVRQLKANQAPTVNISSLVTGTATVPAGTKTLFTATISQSQGQKIFSMVEWSIYNGSKSTPNDYDHGFGGLNRALYPIIAHYSYGDTDNKDNVFNILFINNDTSSVSILVDLQFRYLNPNIT